MLLPFTQSTSHRFYDRAAAGRLLAGKLLPYRHRNLIVVGLARGGVPVAAPIAETLHAPLQVLAVRKIGSPEQPEFAIGALAPHGTIVINNAAIELLDIEPSELMSLVEQERAILEKRQQMYQPHQPNVDLQGKTVIIADDGLATGTTIRAAIKYIQSCQPDSVVLAIPVCSTTTAAQLKKQVHSVVCLLPLDDLISVSLWYQHFNQTTDDEVISLLQLENQGSSIE